jgi:ABC-type nitrate/sulfonate/bicarbonate transport system substrate-binding protein
MTDPAAASLTIGGVPEHFNLPWHLVLETGAAEGADCGVEWHDYATGTGAMLAALADGTLDLAILLTEGAALGLTRGLPIRAISLYTSSPLIWGVHVPAEAAWRTLAELEGRRFAISRPGSGSHLMSLALALEQHWPVAGQSFVVVDDLPGAVAAFRAGRADAFMWERFTTEPAVRAGQLRRLDDFVAPWPAWVVCANADAWQRHENRIEALLSRVMQAAVALERAPDAAQRIASRYGLREAAVQAWLAQTHWVPRLTSPEPALESARAMLAAAGALSA